MNTKQYGTQAELKERRFLLENGELFVQRSTASTGYDLISHNGKRWMIHEIKATKNLKKTFNKEVEQLKKVRDLPNNTEKQFTVYFRGKRTVLIRWILREIDGTGTKVNIKTKIQYIQTYSKCPFCNKNGVHKDVKLGLRCRLCHQPIDE